MISSIFVSGRLGKYIGDGIRLLEVDRLVPSKQGKYETDLIPVRSMLSESSTFYKAGDGTLAIIKGRLEMDKDHGLLIVAEVEEIFSLPEKMKRYTNFE